MMIWLLWAIPCALANRIRGGLFGDYIRRTITQYWGTTVARLWYAAVVALPLLLRYPALKVLAFYVLFYVGLIFRWSPWQHMEDPQTDVMMLTLRGLGLTILPGIVIGSPVVAASGATMGIVYWLAHVIPWRPKEGDYTWVSSDIGEVLFGGVIGLAVGYTLL